MFCIFKGHFQELVIDFFRTVDSSLVVGSFILVHFTEKKGRKINRHSFLKLSTDRVLNECCRVWMFSLTDWIEVECFLED